MSDQSQSRKDEAHELAVDTLESLMCGPGNISWGERAIKLAHAVIALSERGPLPKEVQVAYDKANEQACCGCSQTVQHGPDDMEQVCCGSPVPLCLVDEATARDLGVAIYKHWGELFLKSAERPET